MSQPMVSAPLMFVPDEQAVQQLYERLTETVRAAIAERESSDEVFAQNVFRRALHIIIDTVNASEPNQSVGLTWLGRAENRILFRQAISADDYLKFFKAHLINPHIVSMVEDSSMLSLVREEEGHKERTDLARAILGRWIPNTNDWITGALGAQVSRNTVVATILYWLRHPEDFKGGDAFAARFLRTGPGVASKHSMLWKLLYDYRAMWPLFTGDELQEALEICAERVPNVFFEAPAKDDTAISCKVKLRLSMIAARDVLDLALSNLTTAEGLSVEGLECFSKRRKLRVINRPEICPLPFLVKFSMDYIDLDGYDKFRAYIGQVNVHCTNYAADLAESFRYIREAEQLTDGAPYIPARISVIKSTLLRNAAMHDIVSATVKVVDITDPDAPLGVEHNGRTYVDPFSYEKQLTEGDLVIFTLPATGNEVSLARI